MGNHAVGFHDPGHLAENVTWAFGVVEDHVGEAGDHPLEESLHILGLLPSTRSPFLARYPASFSLPHEDRHERSGEERQHSYQAYSPGDPKGIGNDPGREGAHGVAEVPPETVDAQGASPPGWVGGIRDGRDQRRVDHRRTEAQKEAPE
jgi:hypothetical protein